MRRRRQRSFRPKHFESTCNGALQFKARKFGRERLLMARKRILWHFKVSKESNLIQHIIGVLTLMILDAGKLYGIYIDNNPLL